MNLMGEETLAVFVLLVAFWCVCLDVESSLVNLGLSPAWEGSEIRGMCGVW